MDPPKRTYARLRQGFWVFVARRRDENICIWLYLIVSASVSASVSVSVSLSICLSVCLSIYLSHIFLKAGWSKLAVAINGNDVFYWWHRLRGSKMVQRAALRSKHGTSLKRRRGATAWRPSIYGWFIHEWLMVASSFRPWDHHHNEADTGRHNIFSHRYGRWIISRSP